jgi:excisionase family DNA binding protein
MSEQMAESGRDPAVQATPLTVREVAVVLGVSERTIRRAISRGDLSAIKHTGVLRVAPSDLARYRASHSGLTRPPPPVLRLVPPARPGSAGAGTLPTPLTPFIGREREVAVVRELLQQPDVRLLTLTGPGGVGKTRLALIVAGELRETFGNSIAFVPLASLSDPCLLTRAIAQACGVHESSPHALDETLHNYLRQHEFLLILDNFEHLLPGAPLVADLLAACPRLTILITSRTVLHIYGEHDVSVPPLPVPDLTHLPSIDDLGHYDAVRLFTGRARAARDDFALTPENAAAVAAICQRLDGVPLAIELAAAQSKLLSPQALLARLERGLTLLTGVATGQPARLHSLREAIAWSHDLLTEAEQSTFRRLAVFVDGFTPETAEAVAGGRGGAASEEQGSTVQSDPAPLESCDTSAMLNLVASLLDKSLLRRTDQDGGEPRFGLLETIREFAREQLAASGEDEQVRRRHAVFFLALAERTEPAFYGPDQAATLALLTREHANLQGALAWALEAGELTLALRLAVALGRFWHVAGHLGERQRWLEQILERGGTVPAALRAKALRLLGDGAWDMGDSADAHRFYKQSLMYAEESLEPERIAEALLGLGAVAAEVQGDLATAEECFTRSLTLHDASGNRWGAALMRLNLADIAVQRGEVARARSLIETALAAWQALGYQQGVGRALYLLAQLDEAHGHTSAALPRYEASLAVWRTVHYRAGVAEATSSVGWLRLAQGNHAAAATMFAESLTTWRELASRRGIAASLESGAAIAVGQGRSEIALRLAGTAAELRERTGASPSSVEQSRLAPWLINARRDLGADAARAAWTARAPGGVDAAITEAFDVLTAAIAALPPEDPVAKAATFGLTPREVEVLRLVARRETDREIADALSISPRTTMHHVSHILAKLGVATRREAAVWAAHYGFD